jgi:hypothetical protein
MCIIRKYYTILILQKRKKGKRFVSEIKTVDNVFFKINAANQQSPFPFHVFRVQIIE